MKMKKILTSLALVVILTGCSQDAPLTKTNNTVEQKALDKKDVFNSLDDYFEEIGNEDMTVSKPNFIIEDKVLNIKFNIKYPDKVEKKMKNTKQAIFYQIEVKKDSANLDKYIKEGKSTFYENDLNVIPKQNDAYVYEIKIPLLKKPSLEGKSHLLNGENYALVFLNEKKEEKNVLFMMDTGLNI